MTVYKNYCLNFQFIQNSFSKDIYTCLNISIGTVMKNPQMITWKLKICKQAVKKLQNLLRYVSGLCKFVIIENGETLKCVPDHYKNQE